MIQSALHARPAAPPARRRAAVALRPNWLAIAALGLNLALWGVIVSAVRHLTAG